MANALERNEFIEVTAEEARRVGAGEVTRFFVPHAAFMEEGEVHEFRLDTGAFLRVWKQDGVVRYRIESNVGYGKQEGWNWDIGDYAHLLGRYW
jgi:hypothetical protein